MYFSIRGRIACASAGFGWSSVAFKREAQWRARQKTSQRIASARRHGVHSCPSPKMSFRATAPSCATGPQPCPPARIISRSWVSRLFLQHPHPFSSPNESGSWATFTLVKNVFARNTGRTGNSELDRGGVFTPVVFPVDQQRRKIAR